MNRQVAVAALLLGLTVAVTGCASGPRVERSDDGTLLLVPSSDPRGGADAAAFGTLARSAQGCLGLTSGGTSFLMVMWPYGTTWDDEAQTLSLDGTAVAIGEPVELAGGQGSGEAVADQLPSECLAAGLWTASSI